MKKLVIFDLDGTLLNTITDLGMAANYALEKNGYVPHQLSLYPTFVGNGVRKLMERVLPEDCRTQRILDKVLEDFKSYYSVHNTDQTKPYPYISNLVDNLNVAGIKIAIASNKYQEAAESIIKYYFPGIDFVAIEGQKTGFPVKPDPSIVFSIIEKTGIHKQDILYVGDSGVDMMTAWRACVDSVGVTWGFRSEKELKDNHATFIVSEPCQIFDIVRGINLVNYFNK